MRIPRRVPYRAVARRCARLRGAWRAALAARLCAAAQVAGAAGGEEEQGEAAEDQQRDRDRRRAGRVDTGPVTGVRVRVRFRARARGRVGRRRWIVRRRIDRPACRPRVGLALSRVGQRAENVLLGVRVDEHIHRERADRLLVAGPGVDLVDPPVLVPVGHDRVDHLVRARLRIGDRRGGEHGQRGEREQRGEKRNAARASVWHEIDTDGEVQCPRPT